jgi:hypothetical protein
MSAEVAATAQYAGGADVVAGSNPTGVAAIGRIVLAWNGVEQALAEFAIGVDNRQSFTRENELVRPSERVKLRA